MRNDYRPVVMKPYRASRVGATLYLRDLKAKLFSPFPYLLLALICLLSTYFLGNLLKVISSLSVMVSADPFQIPLFFSVIAIALYLGVTSSTSISHEREQRTLEVLFFGPVTAEVRILALFFRDISVFLISVAFFLVHALVYSLATNLSLGVLSLRTAALSLPLVCPMVGLSLLLSASCRRARTSVLLFVCLFVLLAGLQLASMVLASIPAESISLFVLYLRRALAVFLDWILWISPFSYISRIGGMLETGASRPMGWTVLAALTYTAGLLAAARLVLSKRGKSV